jgi:hypothetical protein
MISHFIAGRNKMNLNQAKAIADTLGVKIEDLYEWV